MKEKIKINLQLFQNAHKGPSFKIFCDEKILDECLDYQDKVYEKTFELDLDRGPHKIIVEHFRKHPKDSNIEQNLDVALKIISLSFNGLMCNQVDLHENYFYPTHWPYPLEPKIKNNLYFGYNGKYEYCFITPSSAWVLGQTKKYRKNIKDIEDFNISEDEFIEKLFEHIKLESD